LSVPDSVSLFGKEMFLGMQEIRDLEVKLINEREIRDVMEKSTDIDTITYKFIPADENKITMWYPNWPVKRG
jgi:hypothetical protein